jgi:hypothetical protein
LEIALNNTHATERRKKGAPAKQQRNFLADHKLDKNLRNEAQRLGVSIADIIRMRLHTSYAADHRLIDHQPTPCAELAALQPITPKTIVNPLGDAFIETDTDEGTAS